MLKAPLDQGLSGKYICGLPFFDLSSCSTSSSPPKMPKIISYTPPWLSRPEPGSQLFASSQGILSSPHREARGSGNGSNKNANGTNRQYLGPKRKIARRGTEIVVAVDNEIRWSDLCMLKDNYDDAERTRKHKGRRRETDNETGRDNVEGKSYDSYRVCCSMAQLSIISLTASAGITILYIGADTATLHLSEREPHCHCHLSYYPRCFSA